MSPVCPPLIFLFFFFFKEKALNNNNKEVEVDRKSVCKPGQKEERSSVFAVFKKVQITAGEVALYPNHNHIDTLFLHFFMTD